MMVSEKVSVLQDWCLLLIFGGSEVEYLILEAISTGGQDATGDLVEQVKEHLADGWQLQGGVCALHENFGPQLMSGLTGRATILMQAMTRP